ncbi:hypothetical protein [Sulfolobus acidocaldarius]|nr:hypothetical protein [Sulfolobus acidocaldarius]
MDVFELPIVFEDSRFKGIDSIMKKIAIIEVISTATVILFNSSHQ